LRFNRVYVEITGSCGLECSFCPPKPRQKQHLSLLEFDSVVSQLQKLTKNISLHLLGDPLTVANLYDYLDIVKKYSMYAHITTSGFFIEKQSELLLTNSAIKQINFSLNAFNGAKVKTTLDTYLDRIFIFCSKAALKSDRFVNLRLWNGGGDQNDSAFYKNIKEAIFSHFGIELNEYNKRTRVASKVIFDFDSYFEWPSKDSDIKKDSYCLGLSDHFGILSDGGVVPCCLDYGGNIILGSIFESSLSDILNSRRAIEIVDGFKNKAPVEELCRKCSYRLRFAD